MQAPNPGTQKAPARGLSGETLATGKARSDGNASVAQKSSLRRCPWFADVLRLAADPIAPYDRWKNTALIFAGAHAWDASKPTRESGRRAVTLLPPGADPACVTWPRVQTWFGDAGDLDAPTAIELARCLIDAGADLVRMIGSNVKPSLTMRRARRGV